MCVTINLRGSRFSRIYVEFECSPASNDEAFSCCGGDTYTSGTDNTDSPAHIHTNRFRFREQWRRVCELVFTTLCVCVYLYVSEQLRQVKVPFFAEVGELEQEAHSVISFI